MKNLEMLMQLLGAISDDQPTTRESTSESSIKGSLENPKLEADGYQTVILPEVFAKLVEARKLLIEAGYAIIDNSDKTESISPYAQVETIIAMDYIGKAVKNLNSVLDIHNEDLVNILNSQAVEHHIPVEVFAQVLMMAILSEK